MSNIDMVHLESWVGRQTLTEAVISPVPARLMAATLDRDVEYREGDPLPPGWHWLYFHEPIKTADLGSDGHARRGGFIPPVPLPRRMWAGGRLTFRRPLPIGERALKRSTIKAITEKQGRSGQLLFVLVAYEISVDGHLCLSEEQDLVYREAARPGARVAAEPAPSEWQWSQAIEPSPVLLFRYSALTFNGHRIHYDREYCQVEEGYPGLVVHGPLVATFLLDLFRRHCPHRAVTKFDYRAVSPLFDTAPFTIHGLRDGEHGRAWAANAQGGLAMTAEVGFGVDKLS